MDTESSMLSEALEHVVPGVSFFEKAPNIKLGFVFHSWSFTAGRECD